MDIACFKSKVHRTYVTKRVKAKEPGEAGVTDRQEKVPGFRQQALAGARVVLVGAGGLGGEIGEGLVRKGVGELVLLDGDVVTLSNLNRQRFFREDLYKNKALRLGRNLAREAVAGTKITAHALAFEEALAEGIDLGCNVAVVGVDSNRCRAAAAERFYREQVPTVFTAVSESANNGYVFVQEPGGACIGCLFPDSLNGTREPCPGVPAVKDILKVVAGIVLYAVDTLLMDRPRDWTYRDVFLDGSVPDRAFRVERREGCPLCAKASRWML